MLSVGRSRLAVLVQLGFLGINSAALLCGTLYTRDTPDLYEGNAHHKLGWMLIWIVAVQSILAVIKLYADRQRPEREHEHVYGVAPMPISAEAMAHHHQLHATFVDGGRGYSDENAAAPESESLRTNSMSGTTDCGDEYLRDVHRPQDAGSEVDFTEKRSLLGNTKVERFLSSVPKKLSRRSMKAINAVYRIIDYSILLLGFIAIATGIVVYGGVFVSCLASAGSKIGNANKNAAARKQCLQWTGTFHQRRHFPLVRPADPCSMDGLLR